MEEDIAGQDVRFTSDCPACGQSMRCSGGQTLVGRRLHWSIDTDCLTCGPTVICGRGDLPADLRTRLLDEHSPARLEIAGQDASTAALMKVIRAELGISLTETKTTLQDIKSGRYTGTGPEIEYLARSLRAAGVDARTVHP